MDLATSGLYIKPKRCQWKGTLTTIELTLSSAVLALVISFIVGLARLSPYRSVRVAAVVYLEFFRGASALVQMFFLLVSIPSAMIAMRLEKRFRVR